MNGGGDGGDKSSKGGIMNIVHKLIVVIHININNNNKYNNKYNNKCNNTYKGIFQITSNCTISDLYVVNN